MAVNKLTTLAVCLFSVFFLARGQVDSYPCEMGDEVDKCYTQCTDKKSDRPCPADRVVENANIPCKVKGVHKKSMFKGGWYYNLCSPVKGALKKQMDVKTIVKCTSCQLPAVSIQCLSIRCHPYINNTSSLIVWCCSSLQRTQARHCDNPNPPPNDKNCLVHKGDEEDIQAINCGTWNRPLIANGPTGLGRNYFHVALPTEHYRAPGNPNERDSGRFSREYEVFCGRADGVDDQLEIQQAHSGYRNVMPLDGWIEEQELRDLQRNRRYRYGW